MPSIHRFWSASLNGPAGSYAPTQATVASCHDSQPWCITLPPRKHDGTDGSGAPKAGPAWEPAVSNGWIACRHADIWPRALGGV